jgi:hypothetical protein
MRAKFFVFCNRASTSANLLAQALDGVRIKRVGSKYRQKPGDVVINYGCTEIPNGIIPTYNKPNAVSVACSKMQTFDALEKVGIQFPSYTTNQVEAQEWAKKGRVLGRNLDRGSKGKGIVFYEKGSVIQNHPFYVKYLRKEREFRFHVVCGKVVHIAEKMSLREFDDAKRSKYIRSHGRGWCLAFNHLGDNPPPPGGEDMAQSACLALGLDFGACDMGWNSKIGWFVLEVNTAPGIEETTLEKYALSFAAN